MIVHKVANKTIENTHSLENKHAQNSPEFSFFFFKFVINYSQFCVQLRHVCRMSILKELSMVTVSNVQARDKINITTKRV